MTAAGSSPSGISVVIPLFNEEENVGELYREITDVMFRFGREYELVFVDDGSRDRTVAQLLTAAGDDQSARVVELRRNFGQTAAMAAGIDHTRFDIVVTMDGDLQNDPAEIPKMVAKLEEGYDLVAGWRKYRQDRLLSRKLPSKIANWLISRSTRVRLHDYGCTLKVLRGELARSIRLYGEMHRFIPALADEVGARIVEIPVNHRPRRYGKSKYGISRTVRVILDLLTVKFLLSYSKRPIHLFGSFGIACSALGAGVILWTVYERFVEHIPMGNRPMFTLAVMLFMVGMQFLVFGLLAEVLARTYYESQNKPVYFVRRVHQKIMPELLGQGSNEISLFGQGMLSERRAVWSRRATR